MTFRHRSRPTSRSIEGRVVRPELWLAVTVLVAMLLVEVWQTSQMAQLCLDLEKTRAASAQASARVDFVRARLELKTTRAELAPLASQLGLAPAEDRQVVAIPSEYLADAGPITRDGEAASVLGLAERASRALVPEATARSRGGN